MRNYCILVFCFTVGVATAEKCQLYYSCNDCVSNSNSTCAWCHDSCVSLDTVCSEPAVTSEASCDDNNLNLSYMIIGCTMLVFCFLSYLLRQCLIQRRGEGSELFASLLADTRPQEVKVFSF